MKLETSTEIVIETLSYMESVALKRFLEIMGERKEAIITGNELSEKDGLTRSIIVYAFQKLKIAGLVRTQGLGMKGTRYEILNAEALHEISSRLSV